MKTEFLEGLLKEGGVPDDKIKGLIDKVMAENGKDVEAEKIKTTAETGKLTTAENTIKSLQEAAKKFDGVDVEKLRKDFVDLEQKYNDDTKAHKAELDKLSYTSAAEKFIDSLKPKDSLSRSAILSEFTKKEFKLDGDTFQGAKEWAETFKKDNASHFTDGEDGTSTSVSSGGGHGDPLAGDVDKFVAAAMKGAGIASEKQ
ncbi:hypothetical protein Sgly_0339 [Syntrophobotulus glycolicus DSM 8271]|uniref:Phage minor structural protein GP20 n=1 Tax=Syntrophobotulus glycolicus (strain DSM 8271 / FlGlyR) TaxID=645991 RepID=F0SXF9_SYNGF|nr:phage scaffolding protein [Syntrophobotulus glycolicus]ADY54705.1 hypothetical protein Sgly_0339 [Syntrophobotulus glycolicus DSM 8271]